MVDVPDSDAAPVEEGASSSGVHRAVRASIPPPFLASTALKEEAAPVAPGSRTIRFTTAAAIAALAVTEPLGKWLSGANPLPEAAGVAVLLGLAAVLIANFAPLPYRVRGALGLVVGALVAALAPFSEGPLALLADLDGWSGRDGLRLLALLSLPAALALRSSYPEYRPLRAWALVAVLLSTPHFVLAAGLTFNGWLSVAGRVAAGLVVAAGVAAWATLLQREDRSGVSGWVGVAVVVLSCAELIAQLASETGAAVLLSAIALFAFATLAGGAAFQLGVSVVCPLARRALDR